MKMTRLSFIIFGLIFSHTFLVAVQASFLIAPINLRITSHFERGIELQWDHENNLAGTLSYVIRYRPHVDPALNSQPAVWQYKTESRRISVVAPLQPRQTYEIQVRAEVLQENSQIPTRSTWSPMMVVTLELKREETVRWLPTPTDFHAFITGPEKLHLEWAVNENHERIDDIHFIISVRKYLPAQGGQRLDIEPQKTEWKVVGARQIHLGSFEAGEKYQLELRSAHGNHQRSEGKATVVIEMPTEADFFKIEEVELQRSALLPPTSVKLKWGISQDRLSDIEGYTLNYWKDSREKTKTYYNTNTPEQTLENLEADTQYWVVIRTHLKNGKIYQSPQFQFRTPTPDPLEDRIKIKSMNSPNSLELIWRLKSYVRVSQIIGYDVLVSKNRNLPDNQWQRIQVNSNIPSVILGNLDPNTEYFIKVIIKKVDGGVIKSSKYFSFRTAERQLAVLPQITTLRYEVTRPGSVRIVWNFAENVKRNMTGILIRYTLVRDAPEDDWSVVTITDTDRTNITLTGLDSGSEVYIKVLPQMSDPSIYERPTNSYFTVPTGIVLTNPAPTTTPPSGQSTLSTTLAQQFQSTPTPYSRRRRSHNTNSDYPTGRSLTLDRCTRRQGCANLRSRCITPPNHTDGWCIPYFLRDVILDSEEEYLG